MKSVSFTEGRRNFPELVDWVSENEEDVVFEKRGKPMAYMIPAKDYALLIEERKRKNAEKESGTATA